MKIEPFLIGNIYRTNEGHYVEIIAIHRKEHGYSTMEGSDGIHRYCDRDHGRVAGSSFDFSHPKNIIPLYTDR